MTRDTVAGDSPRCSARNFRLTDGAEPSRAAPEKDANRFRTEAWGVSVRVVFANRFAAATGTQNFFCK